MAITEPARADAISVDSATIRFSLGGQETLTAVDQCSLTVRDGEFLSVLGPSGCGKTTLLFAVAGLNKLQEGAISVQGDPVTAPTQKTAMVFQDFGLLPWRTLMENVRFPLELKSSAYQSISKDEKTEMALQSLTNVGLAEYRDMYPRQISGGMQQRVGIARALTAGSDVLLMDEPYAALDAQTRDLMGADLLKLWRKYNKTVLFITHSIDEAIYLSDRVVVMSRRPARVKETFEIDIPRPRPLEVRGTPEFSALRATIWECLREEVSLG